MPVKMKDKQRRRLTQVEIILRRLTTEREVSLEHQVCELQTKTKDRQQSCRLEVTQTDDEQG